MKCPVCSNKIQGDDQRLCERCGWEFDRYVTELSCMEREVYDRKLGLARQTWKELLRTKEEVARLEKELELERENARQARNQAQKLENTLKDREDALQHQRKRAEDAERTARNLRASRDELQQRVDDLEEKLKQERANARQARNKAQKIGNTLKDRENALQHQRKRAEDAERTARNLRASRDELKETANRLEQALSQERQNLQGARQEADNLRRSVAELQRSRNILGYVLAAAVIFIAINFLFFQALKNPLSLLRIKPPYARQPQRVLIPPGLPWQGTDNQDFAAVNRPSGDIWTDLVTGMEFVFVKGGCYEMGCGSWTSNCWDVEKPVHTVCVDDFYIGRYEVTQGQWKKIMYSNPSEFDRGDNYPVENVSWDDAQEFIKRLNSLSGMKYRLPTEAEWEYAARSGGRKEKYAGGSDVDRFAWYYRNSGRHTHLVGTKAPNGLGIYDMSGNVYEWCQDWHSHSYYKNSPRNNPQGPSYGSYRVGRGGCWFNWPRSVRSANRSRFKPSYRLSNLGFRLVLSPRQNSR